VPVPVSRSAHHQRLAPATSSETGAKKWCSTGRFETSRAITRCTAMALAKRKCFGSLCQNGRRQHTSSGSERRRQGIRPLLLVRARAPSVQDEFDASRIGRRRVSCSLVNAPYQRFLRATAIRANESSSNFMLSAACPNRGRERLPNCAFRQSRLPRHSLRRAHAERSLLREGHSRRLSDLRDVSRSVRCAYQRREWRDCQCLAR
jgi:hypothetical protein